MKKVILDKLDEQQVKDLLQEKTPDGKVNTVPEIIEKLGDIPDDKTLEEFVKEAAEQSAIDPETLKEAVDDVLQKNVATASDVRAIFD